MAKLGVYTVSPCPAAGWVQVWSCVAELWHCPGCRWVREAQSRLCRWGWVLCDLNSTDFLKVLGIWTQKLFLKWKLKSKEHMVCPHHKINVTDLSGVPESKLCTSAASWGKAWADPSPSLIFSCIQHGIWHMKNQTAQDQISLCHITDSQTWFRIEHVPGTIPTTHAVGV